MRIARFSLATIAALTLAVPAAATEVEVTRFHTPESMTEAVPGPVAVRAGQGLEMDGLETQVWLDAVAAALTRQGFTVVANASRVAQVNLHQAVIQRDAERSRSGVSIGVGAGSGGGYYGRRSGVNLGLGLGFRIGGKHAGELLDTTLSVTILGPDGAHAWEGRAEAAPRAKSKDASPGNLAEEMASKLFSGFPGESGATIGAR